MANENQKNVKCLLLPLIDRNIVIPNANVAEIVNSFSFVGDDSTPDWFLGYSQWRGFEVPLISIEGLCTGSVPENNTSTHYVVLYSLDKNNKHSYYAVVIHGIPHFEFIDTSKITESVEKKIDCKYFIKKVLIMGEEAYIANLDVLEKVVN